MYDHVSLRVLFRQVLLASAPLLGLGAVPGCSDEGGGPCNLPLVTRLVPWTGVIPDGGPGDGGSPVPDGQCYSLCQPLPSGYNSSWCQFVGTDGGTPMVRCSYLQLCGAGRRPEGLSLDGPDAAGDDVGEHFALYAALEAASVDAFDVLHDELRAHGAPPALLRAARRAARDEVRHARMTGALARRFGATPRAHAVARPGLRALDAVACENMAEGCVRETFAALLAMVQARTAEDPAVRAAMTRIARDETRHAELAWAVAAWADARLDRDARGRVADARRGAVDDLRRAAARAPGAAVRRTAGLPGAGPTRALVEQLSTALWG